MALTPEGLTLKQDRFVDGIIATNGNGVRAAEIANYNGSYSTLGVTAHDNLKKPKIQAAIAKRLKPIMNNSEILEELSEIGRHKPKEYTEKGKLKALEMLGKYGGLFNDTLTVTVQTDQLTSALRNLIDLKQRAGELPDDTQLTELIEAACRANNVDSEAVKAAVFAEKGG